MKFSTDLNDASKNPPSSAIRPIIQRFRLYFSFKAILFLIIILERLSLYLQDDTSNSMIFFLVQVAVLPCSLVLEYILIRYMAKKRIRKFFQRLTIIILQICLFQLIIECTLEMYSPVTHNQAEVIRQDILFLVAFNSLFYESWIFRLCLILYMVIMFPFRISVSMNSTFYLYYISWALMMATIIVLAGFRLHKDKSSYHNSSTIPEKVKEELDNHTQGVIVFDRSKQLLHMNGNFKGLLEISNSSEASEEFLKLRKFDSHPERVRRGFLEEVKNEKVNGPQTLGLQRKPSLRKGGGLNRQLSRLNTLRKSADSDKQSVVTFKESVDVLKVNNRKDSDERIGIDLLSPGRGKSLFLKVINLWYR